MSSSRPFVERGPPAASAAGRRASPGVGVGVALALALATALSLLFPGDAPWINDEPRFILLALEANQAGELATHALVGSQGIPYGPVAIWIYQLLLRVSNDPVALVVLHAILLGGGTSAGLFWLARTLRLWRWFAVLLALSPYLWFYNRLLWDNSFNIPLSALAVAAYCSFLQRGSMAPLLVAVACSLLAPVVHPMGVALAVPILLHLLLFQRARAWRFRWHLLALLAVAVALCWGYAKVAWTQVRAGELVTGQKGLAPNGFAFPLLGPRLLSALGLDYFFGPEWGRSPLLTAARAASSLAFAFAWAGIVLAVRRVRSAARARRAEPLDHAAGLALGILAAQVLLDGVARIWVHPHYFNATWIAFALFAWLSVDALVGARRLRGAVAIYGASLASSTVALVAIVHATGGTRGLHYGPTLRNQMEVAAEIDRHPAGTPITTDVPHYVKFPHALSVLRRLTASGPGAAPPARELVIRYRSADPRDGRVEVVAQ